MKKLIIPAFLFTGLFILSYARAETVIKAEVDKTSMTTDEELTYRLTIISSAKIIPQPRLPEFLGFYISSSVQSSQVSFSRGTLKTTASYVLLLLPEKTGRLKIEPAQIAFGGRNYSSDAFEIEVKPGKIRIQPPKSRQKSSPSSKPQTEEEPQFTL